MGDTVKFGRVRYKLVMTHDVKNGLQKYNMHDRFLERKRARERRIERRQSRHDEKMRRRSTRINSNANSQRMSQTQRSLRTGKVAEINRRPSQITEFD